MLPEFELMIDDSLGFKPLTMVRYSKCSGINSLKLQLNSLSDILFKWIFFWPTMRWNVVCATKGFECWVGLHLASSPSTIQSIVADLEQFTSKRVGDRGCFALLTISFFRISLKHDKSAFVAYLFCIQIWRKRFLICQAHLCHIWSIIDAQQNFSISKQSQITRILLLLLLLSPFSILFSFLLGSIFSRFYFPFIWYFQLIGGFKVRHFTNAFPSKRSKIVEHVLLHPISQFTKTSLFSWKMRATLLRLDDKYKLAKKTLQKQLSVTSMPAATGLWRLTGQLSGTLKKSHIFL